jgi:hypothetical protein
VTNAAAIKKLELEGDIDITGERLEGSAMKEG